MRTGDVDACEEFYRRYEPFMRSVARYWLSPQVRRHADSADMVQSVFRIAFDNVGDVEFADETKVRHWLGRVMRGRVARAARRIRGPGGREIEDVEAHSEDLGDAALPETIAAHAELIHLLKSTLERLPERERRVIRLREFEGRDYAEIATLTGLPSADAARKQHGRAIERLRELMAGAAA
jgi:RNA polymerase sigma factor (sigma-70 family)